VNVRRLAQNLKQLLDHRIEQRRSPADVSPRSGAAQAHPEQRPQQVVRFFQRDSQLSAASADQQPRTRSDVRSRQFQITPPLTRAAAIATLLHMPPVTVQLDCRLGDVFDELLVKAARFFEVLASAVRTAFQPHVVVDRVFVGNRRLAKHAGMFAMRWLAEIGSSFRLLFRVRRSFLPRRFSAPSSSALRVRSSVFSRSNSATRASNSSTCRRQPSLTHEVSHQTPTVGRSRA
jgi:hypothetical protein